MPLLDDAESCFVNNQSINTILAGEDVVWEKNPNLDLQWYYRTTSDEFDSSVGRRLYAAWTVKERPVDCDVALGDFGIQWSFDDLDDSNPQWKQQDWDASNYKYLPRDQPNMMIQGQMDYLGENTRYRLVKNGFQPTIVFSDELRIQKNNGPDTPGYILKESLPRLPIEWIQNSVCAPPLVIPEPCQYQYGGTWYTACYLHMELPQSVWRDCNGMKSYFEYRLKVDDVQGAWTPFNGWCDYALTGGDMRGCYLWLTVMLSNSIQAGVKYYVEIRDTAGEHRYNRTQLSSGRPDYSWNTRPLLMC